MESKAETRKKMINFLIKMSKNDKKEQSQKIISKLVSTDNWHKSRRVALFLPTEIEFDLTPLFKIARNEQKEILIPKCLPQRKMLFSVYDPNALEKSNFGILEPKNPKAVTPDYIVVPGLAWNKAGYRIGFGGGYYDRYLADFTGKTASVFYNFQSIDFKEESHDIMVQECFTTQQ